MVKKKWKVLSGAAARTGRYKLRRKKKILINRRKEDGLRTRKIENEEYRKL